MNTKYLNFLVLISLILAVQTTRANVKIAVLFIENMVLQANHNLKVRGTADEAESVIVEMNGNEKIFHGKL